MTIWPLMDKEWDDLSHVILTADTDWDLTIIDCELVDKEEWYDAIMDFLEVDLNFLFDNLKDYKKCHSCFETTKLKSF